MEVTDTAKMRRPTIAPSGSEPTGHVKRDDRGNAVWEWTTGDDDPLAATMNHPGLVLADQPPAPDLPASPDPVAAKKGYNPYGSGLIERKDPPRKRNLRELSKWIALRKKIGQDDTEP
jgi:hypothetical protein